MTAARPPRTDHYSYSVYADPAMAEAFDAMRFGLRAALQSTPSIRRGATV